jgi:hypothetical protein
VNEGILELMVQRGHRPGFQPSLVGGTGPGAAPQAGIGRAFGPLLMALCGSWIIRGFGGAFGAAVDGAGGLR